MKKAWLTLLLCGCPGSAPCTSCPPVEGTWFLSYVAPDFACDGGTLPAPQSTVAFTREGSVLRSTMDGVELRGTVYDSYDFTLNGQTPGGGEAIALQAVYQAAANADAGSDHLIEGRLSRSVGGCTEDRRFTGARY